MKPPTLYAADGVTPLDPTVPETGGMKLSTTFNIETGRGMVRLLLPPGAVNLEELATEVIGQMVITAEGEPSDGAPRLLLEALRKAAAPRLFQMHPAEARLLGMQLISQAERAMGDAVGLRICLEVMGLSHGDAVQLWTRTSAGTLADHAMAFERDMKSRTQDAAMENPNGTSKPS